MGRLEKLSGLVTGTSRGQYELVNHYLLLERIHVVFVDIFFLLVWAGGGGGGNKFGSFSQSKVLMMQIVLLRETVQRQLS